MKTGKSTVYFFNILAALVLLVIIPSLCLSAVPLRVNYQGYLTDSTGGPVDTATEPGGTIQIRFSLHDALSVGNELWFEEQAVQVIQGVYSVELGSSTPIPTLDFNSQYYLEIAIDEDASTTFDPGEELTPRQALTSVPYSLNADKVDGMDSGDFAASSHNHSGTEINSGTVAEARIDTAIARSADITSAVSTHAADASVHHTIYTDANAVNAVQTASYITDLQNRIAALEAKLVKVTTDGNNIYITGANLHVRNTSGTTDDTVDGLGNIIIGWNELRGGGDDSKGGSHNLVLGMRNNYSSFGGIVLGHFNSISADHAAITGGETNTASAAFATITGGTSNTASHLGSTVIGGLANSTSSLYDIKP